MVLNELEAGLKHHSLITSEEQRQRYRELLDEVRREYEDIVKNEVQRAIAADEAAISRLCAQLRRQRQGLHAEGAVRNQYTGQDEEPDERLMRSIEEKIDIPESRKDDFRREIMNYIGALALDGQEVRLPHERAAAQGARAEAVRGPEGHDQADEPGLERRRQGDAGEDRHRQGPPGPRLRLLRLVRDRRPALRGEHLRPRRREGALSSRRARRVRARIAVRPEPLPADRARARARGAAPPPRPAGADRPAGQATSSRSRSRTSSCRTSSTTPAARASARARARPARARAPGSEPGQHMLEAEFTVEELASMLGEALELPRIRPKGRDEHRFAQPALHRHRHRRPRVAAPLQALATARRCGA